MKAKEEAKIMKTARHVWRQLMQAILIKKYIADKYDKSTSQMVV